MPPAANRFVLQQHRAGIEHHSGNGVRYDHEGCAGFEDHLFEGNNSKGETALGDFYRTTYRK